MRTPLPARLAISAAVLLLVGAGCDLGSKVSLPQLPFFRNTAAPDPAKTASDLKTETGTKLRLRPTFLGVTGSVADILGESEGVRSIDVTTFGGGTIALDWTEQRTDAQGKASTRKGSVSAGNASGARAMLLPAFWKPEASVLDDNAVIWLSPKAYRELTQSGATEWRIGLADAALGSAAKTLAAFNQIASKLALSASATSALSAPSAASDPFLLKASADPAVFPLRIDGSVENVAVIRASGWFADYVILKNPENPLILKVNVNPLALGALNALSPLGIDPKSIGYEITSVERPSRPAP